MRIALFNAPGRLPTVIHDVGAWWDRMGADPSCQLESISLNFAWWRLMASREIARILYQWPGCSSSLPTVPRGFLQKCEAAEQSLRALQGIETYRSADEYTRCVGDLEEWLEAFNAAQNEFVVSLADGPMVRSVNYHDSQSIADFTRAGSILGQTVEQSLPRLDTLDVALMRVTSEAELLTGALAARFIRQSHPNVHVCLIDHGYENFSLGPHLSILRTTGHFARLFDTVVESKDEIDGVVVELIAALSAGKSLRGFLSSSSFGGTTRGLVLKRRRPLPWMPTIAPEPVLHTRASPRSCYWGKCAYCTQNSKYSDSRAPSKLEVIDTIDRLVGYVDSGYRNVIFSDEAISPAMLRSLSDEILRRGVEFAWACRCKLERSFSLELFAAARRAGCVEILFGLETISPKLLKRMDKFVEGQTPREVADVFRWMAQVGIGIHVNLINGFPGEEIDEAEQTVRFVCECLGDHPNATFLLNRFTVFPATPIADNPYQFGLSQLSSAGDMPAALGFRLAPGVRRRTSPVVREFENLVEALEHNLGWSDFLRTRGGRVAHALYSSSGHSSIFKRSLDNPVDARRTKHGLVASRRKTARRRRRAFLTGATGCVGRVVLRGLQQANWHVSALVRKGSTLGGDCQEIVGDLTDLPDLSDVLDGMDAIVHCGSPRSKDRELMIAAEVTATGRLLDAWSTGTFIYMSSQTVYGVPSMVLDERSPVDPGNWYDLSKITNEHHIQFSAKALGGAGVSFRLPLVFSMGGARGGEQFLPLLLNALRVGKTFVFRSREKMATNGSVYIGPEDLARCVLASVDFASGGVFNIASGFTTWKHLIECLGEFLGVEPRFAVKEGAPGTEEEFWLPDSCTNYDCSRFHAAAGFVPHTDVRPILKQLSAVVPEVTTPWRLAESGDWP